MPLLTHQAQADMKACTLEKDLANLKTVRNLVFTLGRKLTNLRNMTNPLLNTHVLEAIRVFTLKRNFTDIRNVTNLTRVAHILE
ncbi:hypothetical protein U0070_025666 [Myodes glareolus]|uniref:Uncharacterized protein n=1 Tax=Myodes glareolus TaxID=447135 RepID=A0AAW0I4Z8_MYOGA